MLIKYIKICQESEQEIDFSKGKIFDVFVKLILELSTEVGQSDRSAHVLCDASVIEKQTS